MLVFNLFVCLSLIIFSKITNLSLFLQFFTIKSKIVSSHKSLSAKSLFNTTTFIILNNIIFISLN